MSNANKNILITPNRGSTTDDPKIEFVGANSNTTAETIAVIAKPDSNGTVSFEANTNQLFSITNSLTGTVFSVNDADGVPVMEADADGTVRLAEFGGRVGIGVSEPLSALDINATDAITLPRGTSAQRPANPIGGMMRYNTDFDSVEWYDAAGQQWNSIAGVSATGGVVTEITQDGIVYRVHTFTDVGTSSFQVLRGGEVEYLVVAGGGGGANYGGGGSGRVVVVENELISVGSYAVVVGAGSLSNGQSSSFASTTAAGGSAGLSNDGGSGGSGGGALGGPSGSPAIGGVGGSDGSNGASARGTGGAGLDSTTMAFGTLYAGGGGGGSDNRGSGTTAAAQGGAGGGGEGAALANGWVASPGMPNTGSGGGGMGYDGSNAGIGGSGGSGIVIVRYRIG